MLRGRTVDERGLPLGSVQVSVTSLRSDSSVQRTAWSEVDGSFEVENLPPPPWRVRATDPSHAPATVDVVDGSRAARLVLVPGVSISGSVRDDRSGEAIGGAHVELVRDDLPPERIEARSNDAGEFRFARVRQGAWEIQITERDHISVARQINVSRDLSIDPISLVAAGRVSGVVVDSIGVPVPRAVVHAGEASAECDPQGRFTVSGVAPGSVEIEASHPASGAGRSHPVRVWSGETVTGTMVRLSERFDPARAAELPPPRRGVAIVPDGSPVRAATVIPGSRAWIAGVRDGDELVSIDGSEPTDADDAERLLRGPSGVPAVILVRRGEVEAVLVVDRESWSP
jgi:hypothetical protein